MQTLSNTISGLGITLLVATGAMTGDYYLVKDIPITQSYYSQYEYDQLKPQLISIIKTHKVTPQQFQAWSSMADKEIKNCGSIDILNYDKNTFIDDLNAKLESGKC